MNEKIHPSHLARKAFLYIRQSSTYQVTHYRESQRLQYGMKVHLERLGWQNIEVIDEDLGRTASGVVQRTGFDRMVAEVCLGASTPSHARHVLRGYCLIVPTGRKPGATSRASPLPQKEGSCVEPHDRLRYRSAIRTGPRIVP